MKELLDSARGWSGIFRRIAAACYDGMLLGALLMLFTALALLLAAGRSLVPEQVGLMAYVYRCVLLLVVLAYFGVSWTRSGETLGMKAWGLRIVRRDGEALRWRDVALRLLFALPLWLAAVAVGIGVLARRLPAWAVAPTVLPVLLCHATLLIGPDALHDRLSGTRVLRVRRGAN